RRDRHRRARHRQHQVQDGIRPVQEDGRGDQGGPLRFPQRVPARARTQWIRMSAVLIAAAAGRALAASARRGGYAPLVADFFGDRDTVAAARAHVRLDDGLRRGMTADALLAALAMLAAKERPQGVVCGTGFEDRPALLARIAERWPL